MKRGLVLEGGGMRGLFTEGFINVLMENNIRFDGIAGVSAGVIFGSEYKAHQPKRGLRLNVRFIKDKEYMSFRSLWKTGNYISAEYGYHTIPMELEKINAEMFSQDPTEFHIGCTDIEKGESVFKKVDHIDYETLEWFRASASMPLLSKPVDLDGKKLLDGGMSDSIPLQYFQSIGYEKNLVVLTQPKGYRKKPSSLNILFDIFCKNYPKIGELMRNRHIMYNNEIDFIEEQEKMGKTLVIRPDSDLNIGRVEQDKDKMYAVYELGRKKGLEMLDAVKSFLNE